MAKAFVLRSERVLAGEDATHFHLELYVAFLQDEGNPYETILTVELGMEDMPNQIQQKIATVIRAATALDLSASGSIIMPDIVRIGN